jgi:hypothetical protein
MQEFWSSFKIAIPQIEVKAFPQTQQARRSLGLGGPGFGIASGSQFPSGPIHQDHIKTAIAGFEQGAPHAQFGIVRMGCKNQPIAGR